MIRELLLSLPLLLSPLGAERLTPDWDYVAESANGHSVVLDDTMDSWEAVGETEDSWPSDLSQDSFYFSADYVFAITSVSCSDFTDYENFAKLTYKIRWFDYSDVSSAVLSANCPCWRATGGHLYFWGDSRLARSFYYNTSSYPTMTYQEAIADGIYQRRCIYYSTFSSPSSVMPYYLLVHDTSITRYQFSDYLIHAVSSFYDSYCLGYLQGWQGYQDGYNAGLQDGKSQGYAEGYHEGINAVSDGAIVTSNLFGGVVSIPISILNGLSVLTIWNVPVIGIVITFLFIGLILWLIKRFI